MFDIENYSSFIIATLVFQIVPGAGTVTILNATVQNGVGMGMCAVIGTLTGDFIYMSSAVLGLAAVLKAYPSVLASAQWIGAAYLCCFGWKLLRSSLTERPAHTALSLCGPSYYRQALAVSLTNPKVIMFFMAFFPLFIRSEPDPTTLFILMIHVTAISFLYQTGLVLVGNSVARWFSKWQYARLLSTRIAAVALIGLGVKLALSNR